MKQKYSNVKIWAILLALKEGKRERVKQVANLYRR